MHDLIIIGAGPAGLTAALYAGRFRLNTLVLEKMSPGGQIILSATIENFPGFPKGIATGDLIEKMRAQVDELGLHIEMQEALEIIPQGDTKTFRLKTESETYETRSIIVASGAMPKKMDIPGEDRFIGRGVSYCGTCDGPLFRDKDILIIGAGDRAFEEALFLSGYASKVTIIHRRQGFRASKILEEKIRSNPKISFLLDSVVEEITGTQKVEAVKVKNLKSGITNELKCQGVFVFVGIKPNTNFLKNQLQLDEKGFIITAPDGATSREGIFASGDCCKKSLYQVVNACGEGAVAADSVYKFLANA